jgi:hypothetical protein
VAEAVVDRFEAVQVEDRDADRRAAAPAACELALERLVERPAVAESCELVAAREPVRRFAFGEENEPLIAHGVGQRHEHQAEHPGEQSEQPHLRRLASVPAVVDEGQEDRDRQRPQQRQRAARGVDARREDARCEEEQGIGRGGAAREPDQQCDLRDADVVEDEHPAVADPGAPAKHHVGECEVGHRDRGRDEPALVADPLVR